MLTHRQKIGLPLLLVLASANVQCYRDPTGTRAQTRPDKGIAVGAVKPTQSSIRGKAGGHVPEFRFGSNSLKASLFSHSAPEIWLIYPSTKAEAQPTDTLNPGGEATVKVDLSPEVRRMLGSQWQAALAYFYETEIENVADAGTYYSKSVTFSNSSLTTMRLLEVQTVEDPSGRRNISADEAGDLVRFVNAAAAEVVAQAKRYKNEVDPPVLGQQ